MPQRDNIISFGGRAAVSRQPALNGDGAKVVRACRDLLARTLPQLLAGLFEKIDDALYELADKADTNSLQTGYFSAMRDIRKERSRVEKEFGTKILAGYDRFWQYGTYRQTRNPSEQGGISPTDLALVADDELEESLAVNNMVSKGENRYHQELYALDRRFACVLPGVEVDNQNNPLAPAALCSTFRDAIRGIEADIPVRLVIYKLFDRQVMHYVGGLYDDFNGLFGQANIMPKLTPKINRNPVAPGTRRTEHRQGPGPQGNHLDARGQGAEQSGYGQPAVHPDGANYGYPTDAEQGAQAEVFHLLQQLLSARRSGFPPAQRPPAGVAALPLVETGEVLRALSSLQHSNIVLGYDTPVDAAVSVTNLKVRLSEQLKLVRDGEAHKAIGRTDDDTIDVVGMLFEFIMEDKNLPDAMKVLLSRLQIPMLKLAIMDKSFFSKTLHPARRLLNSMAQAAVGWSDERDKRKDNLYGKIESVVNRILMDFEDDPGLFAKLNDEFSEYLEKERRGAVVTEERTAQVTRGKEQLKTAKDQVAHEIDSRLIQCRNVPDVVVSLLQEGWKDVLLLNYLRQGPDSEAWQNSVNLIDRLLWSIEPKTDFEERQELLRDIPELLKRLREGLAGISYDQHKMAHLLKELQACHIACLRGARADSGTTGDAPDPDAGQTDRHIHQNTAVDETGVSVQTDEMHERDTHFRQAESLKVGTWLEITGKDGVQTRAKLSWKSDVSDAHVLVNRKGMKVMQLSMQELAAAFRKGKAKMLEKADKPIMDRALSAMMKTLKDRENGKAPPPQHA
jgi:hypothetical protein